MEIAMVLHSRVKENAKDGEKYSEVMTEIANGARSWPVPGFEEIMGFKHPNPNNVNLKIYSPVQSYSSANEFLSLINYVIYNEDSDVIIMPFSLCMIDWEEAFIANLSSYDGRVIAINVPPTRKIVKETNINYLGYVGGDERTAGKRLVDQIFFKKNNTEKIYILNHKENHYEIRLRIDGAENQVNKNEALKDVETVCIDSESSRNKNVQQIIAQINKDEERENFGNDFGIATLGVRGTEMAIEIKKEMGIDFPIVGMDINDTVKQAIKDGIVFSTLIQEPSPHQQGWQAVAMAVDYLKATIHEPKIISVDNIDSYK